MARSTSEQFLCIGDEITLHDEDGNVLVTEDPLETRAYARLVSSGNDHTHSSSSEALGARLFQVEPQLSYTERRALEHFLGDEKERENLYYEGSPDELVELSVLESRAAKERIQNDAEKRRLFGKPVIYGQVIQLYNAHFKKYLTVTGRTCESDTSHLQVDLSKDIVGYFKIIPRYRIRVDGEPVRLGDTVAIQCLRPEGFLNVGSHRLHSDVFNFDYYEIYTHTRISSWTLQAHRTAASRQVASPEKFINTGQYLRFYHKEMEAYLEAPMSRRDKTAVRLRKHVINPLDPKESDSPLAFWEIENVTPSSGSKVRWKRSVRIRHAASRAYLYIDPSNVSIDMKTHKISFSFGLVSNPQNLSNNDATLFTLVPASDTKDSNVSFGTYVRVQHVLTKCWMHSDTDESSFNRTSESPIPTMQSTQAPEPLNDHRATARKSIASIASSISDRHFSTDPNAYRSRTFATPTYPITASQDFHYHDCFSITLVDNKLHDTFNYINEMIPQLHSFLSKERPSNEQSRFPIADKEYISLKRILEALIEFCTHSKEVDVSVRAGIANEYHQALLRDIGAIEAAINIIQIPFNLSKRYELRPSLSARPDSMREEVVSIIDLHNGREERLRSILLLCYNLLRVFLIQGEDLEEVAKNQQHILQLAGDAGIELFIRHLTCGVGATDMISLLLDNNTQVVDAIAAIRPQIVSILVNLTIEKLKTMVKRLIRCDNGYLPESRADYEAASSVALLGPLCPTNEQHASSTTNHGDYIASRLFSTDNCLLQTRIIKETGVVQVLILGDDEWRDLEELLEKCPRSVTLLLQHSLRLIYLLSMEANAKRLRAARTCVPEDVCLRCLSNVQLPDNIRAAFCDMLHVLYINVPPYSNVLLTDFTLQYDHLLNTNDYPSGGSGDIENRTPPFFENLKRWTMVFLDEKRHQFAAAKGEIALLNAVLKLVHSELRLGFFTDSNDMKRLFRSLIYVLDGRTDARNLEHLRVIQHDMARPWKERYILTEETRPVMDVKICILEIFDLIFDLRLHVRINKLASKWKDMENNVDTEAQHSRRGMLVSIFEETMLRQRENILMPILKDILRYQYAPLKRIAVIIMHRIYNDCEDLFKKAKKVLLLGEPQQVFVYYGVKKRLARIGTLLSIDRLSLSQLPALEHLLRELLSLFQGKTVDMDDRIVDLDRPQNQRVVYSKIFKNLSAHSLMARLLLALKRQLLGSATVNGSLSSENLHSDRFDAEVACVDNMKLCLDLLYELAKDDREFQGHFVISHMDVLIDIGECHPTLASALIPICGNNLHISLRVDEAHIQRILELARGYQGEYLQLLRVFVKAQGKLLKKHQDCIVRCIMDKREIYVPFETAEDMLTFGQADYCAALLELLSVCGQNDNTFAQSFARTLFSIHDLVTVITFKEARLNVKASAYQFLASIYLDNVELPSNVPISEDPEILGLMDSCCDAMSELKPESSPEMVHYVYHGILVFLRSMFEHHLNAEIIVDERLRRLCPKLVDLAVGLLQITNAGSDRKALKNALACLDSMINVAGFGSSVEPDRLREKLRRAIVKANDKRDKITRLMDSINAKFQGFIRALMAHNDVKMLMHNEFKQLGSHFSLAHASSKDDVKSLIDYLSMMTNVKEVDPREGYQVATIRLLEEIPLQYIRERSKQNHLDDPMRYELLEKKKMHAQNTLNRLGCTLVAQNLLSSPRKNIFEAAIKLLIALLEGGNKNVQDRLEEYFYSIREERFFYSFHHRLQTSIESLKEAQVHLVRAAQKMHRQQFSVNNSNNNDAKGNGGAQPPSKTHHHRRQLSSLDPTRRRTIMYDSQVGANQFGQQSAVVYQKFASLMTEETAEFGTTSEEFESMRDTMRALQLMVEGHNINLQRYLAKQPDNIKSFNIVQDVVEYLHAIAPICNIQNVRLIIQVLDTITDLAQGCPENQLTIFTHKIVNPANIILRESYNNCPSSLIDELKSKVMICLLSLLEGGMDNSEMIFREMAASLDLSVVIRNMSLTYDSNVDHLNSSGVYEKLECGFQYCMLLMTLWPALPENQRAILAGNQAFDFFQKNTGKIEVVMDYNQEKQLSRVLFPIPEICKYLREDTKQRFLWNVKRDSPSAKIEDFVQLSNNIIYEIESHAKVASNKYLSMLSNHSKLWWIAAYATTVLLNMLMLGCSSTFLTLSDPDNRAFCYRFENALHTLLGLLHIIFWSMSTAEFSFVQLPIIVNRNNPSKQQQMFGHDANRSDTLTMEIFSQSVKIDFSSIAGQLLERSFLYHVIMLCLSFVGFYNPTFYSLHLLDFAFRDRVLQGVIASITLNVNPISRTALFGIIVVYIHSVVAYVFFRDEFDISKGLHCSTLSQCFVTILSHGVRAGGGIGDILEPDDSVEPRGWRTAFEMSFFLLVVVFLLNAIFGIIFDTFGHLRDERSAVQQDIKNSCFICSIPAIEFQRQEKNGFDKHVKHDHNIWQYLFFLVHLKTKDRTEYTGPESYVADCLKDANYNFFPVNRALCLRQKEQDDTERLEKLEETAHKLLEKMNSLEESVDKLSESQSRSRSNSLMLSPM